MAKLHHSAIARRDVEASLVFWRDGLGFEVVVDQTFEGPWPELVARDGTDPPGADAPGPAEGLMLLSLHADLDTVLPRLAALGGGESRPWPRWARRAWPCCATPTACGWS